VYESELVTGLAAAFGAMSVVLGLIGVLTNPLALVPALLFAAVAYFMWYHASGRLAERVYAGVEAQATGSQRRRAASDGGRGGFGAGPRQDWERPGGRQRRRRRARGETREQRRRERARQYVGGGGGAADGRRRRRRPADAGPTRQEAADRLGVDPDADDDTLRRAYRERIKDTHPDTEGGDEAAFKRVQAAYERLQE
jgi:hypothetical protein